MIENPIKRLWAEGKATVNGWLSTSNGFTAEIMASAGFDSVTADLQHGAFERVEEIAATPGLDGLYIGPAALTLGLTGRKYRTGFDREEPEMVEALHRIRDAARAAGIRACLHNGSAAYPAKAIGWGFDLVTVSNDVRLLAGAAEAGVAEVRRRVGEARSAGSPAQAPAGPGGC